MRIVGGLTRLAIATVMAGVLVAGLLLPYVVGLGLTTNKITATILATPDDTLDYPFPVRSTVTDDAGNPIATLYSQDRVVVPLSQISTNLQDAVISIEDRRFEAHPGVDWKGTVRALLKNSQGSGGTQGGSTLTQQYVKNYKFLVEAKTATQKAAAIADTPLRKLQEAKLALVLEQHDTKADILERYLNLVAFAPNVYGAEASSEYFFDKPASALDVPQAALMAGMVNNPIKYNPLNPSQALLARTRRDEVLDAMASTGAITKTQAATFKQAPLELNSHPTPSGCVPGPNSAVNGYFCTYAVDYLQNTLGMTEDQIDTGGYTIKTTMDPTATKAAKAAVDANVNPTANPRVANVMSVIAPTPGVRKVTALVANRPYGLNAALGQTQQRLPTTFAPLGAGSTFKVFTAAEALSEGLGTNSIIDVPATYTSAISPAHAFHNAGTFAPSMSLQTALAESPNTAFVALESEMGLQKVVAMAVALGMKGYSLDAGDVDQAFADTGMTYAQLITKQNIASFTLGVSPVSPEELSNVGATLVSDGIWCPPTPIDTITKPDGSQVVQHQASCVQAIPADLARTLSAAMEGDLTASFGTANRAAVAAKWTRTTAGKTGTTNDYKSSAFLGFTPYYSGAVMTWDYLTHPTSICVVTATQKISGSCSTAQAMGETKDKTTQGMSGGSVPAATWLAAMGPLHASLPPADFKPPTSTQYITGADNAQVPNVVGLPVVQAQDELTAAGFTMATPTTNLQEGIQTGAAANIVIKQTPQFSALPHSQVAVVISAGISGPPGG